MQSSSSVVAVWMKRGCEPAFRDEVKQGSVLYFAAGFMKPVHSDTEQP